MGYIPPTIEEAQSTYKTLLWYKKQRARFAIVVGGGLIGMILLLTLVLYFKLML